MKKAIITALVIGLFIHGVCSWLDNAEKFQAQVNADRNNIEQVELK